MAARSDNRQHITISLVAFVITFYIISPRIVFGLPGLSLDASYEVALNYFLEKGFVYGKEIVFTYGPLAFLQTRKCQTDFQILLNILLTIGTAISYSWFLSRYLYFSFLRRDYFFTLVLLISLVLLPFLQKDFIFSLLLLYYILTREIYSTNRFRLLYILPFIIPLAFFTKANVGIFILIHYVLFLLFLVLSGKLSIRNSYTITSFLLTIGFLYTGAFIFHVDIPWYIYGSIQVIKDYNELFQLVPSPVSLYFLLAFMLVSLVGLVFVLKDMGRENLLTVLFLLANAFSMLFVAYKQAFVRSDTWHLLVFFLFSFYFVLTAFNPAGRFVATGRYKAVLCSLVLVVSGAVFIIPSLPEAVAHKDALSNIPFYNMFQNAKHTYYKTVEENKKERVLPSRFIEKIKDSSVDIFPWELTFVLYNGLNYRPRPVFQSYIAVSPYLDSLNASFLRGINAPQFLLYSSGVIDNRHPFSEEVKTRIALAERYKVVDSVTWPANQYIGFSTADNNPRMLLLEKIRPENEYNVKLSFVREFSVTMSDHYEIQLPETENILFLQADIHKKIAGKLRSILFQSPIAGLYVKQNNSWSEKYRISLRMLSDGILINKRIFDTSDSELFFRGHTKRLENIQAIQFDFDGIEYFDIPKEVRFREFKVITSPSSAEDS